MIINLIDKAVVSGARLKKAAGIVGLSARTIIRWRKQGGGQDQRNGPLTRAVPVSLSLCLSVTLSL